MLKETTERYTGKGDAHDLSCWKHVFLPPLPLLNFARHTAVATGKKKAAAHTQQPGHAMLCYAMRSLSCPVSPGSGRGIRLPASPKAAATPLSTPANRLKKTQARPTNSKAKRGLSSSSLSAAAACPQRAAGAFRRRLYVRGLEGAAEALGVPPGAGRRRC